MGREKQNGTQCKTKDMRISFKKTRAEPQTVSVGRKDLQRVDELKLLGLRVQKNLKWNSDVDDVLTRASKQIYYLRVCWKATPY